MYMPGLKLLHFWEFMPYTSYYTRHLVFALNLCFPIAFDPAQTQFSKGNLARPHPVMSVSRLDGEQIERTNLYLNNHIERMLLLK